MVAVFSGNGLGLFRSSLTQLGFGLGGQAGLGQSRESQYVNLASGNLVLQGQDEVMTWQGLSVGLIRTYNSQGTWNTNSDVGLDGFVTGFERSVALTKGRLGKGGSEMSLRSGDGSTVAFKYRGLNTSGQHTYESRDGDGAHDALSWDQGSGTWTWVEGSTRRQEVFADHANTTLQGRLLRIVDGKSGAKFEVIYSGSRIAEVNSENGDGLLFGYAAGNARQLTSIATRENGVTRGQVFYAYDSVGRLSRVTTDLTPDQGVDASANTADGQTFWTQYTYINNTNLRVARVEQSDGVVASYTYDASGRIASVTSGDTNTNDADGQGQTQTFTYEARIWDAASGQYLTSTHVTDSAGRAWTYRYDDAGQLCEVLAPAVEGQRASTRYEYDSAGNLSRVTDADGRWVIYGYDGSGNVMTELSQGRLVTRQYSASNQLICETVYPELDSAGAPVMASAQTTRYVYDTANRLRYVINALGQVTEYRYAAVGATGANQLVSTHAYLGNAYNIANLGAAHGLTESQLNNWAASQDKGQTTRVDLAYDVRGALFERRSYAAVDAQGAGILNDAAEIVRYSYDAQGLLVQQVALRGIDRTTSEGASFIYDGMGRLVSSTDALGNVTTQTYVDSQRQVRVEQLGSGLVRVQAYDRSGRVILATESAIASGESHGARWYYDAQGQLRASEDAGGARRYRFYDAAGRLQAEVDETGAAIEYRRNASGQVLETIGFATRLDTTAWLVSDLVQPTDWAAVRPGVNGDDRHVQSTYDAMGRLATEIDGVGVVTRYTYDGRSLLVSKIVGADGSAPEPRFTRWFYDAAGRKTGELNAEGYLTEWVYDRAGRNSMVIAYGNEVLPEQRGATRLNQLRPESSYEDRTTRMFYDGRGNLIGKLDAECYLVTYTVDEAGRVRSEQAYAAKLDDAGDLDSLASLLSAAQSSGSMRESRLQYDANGRLVLERNPEGTFTQYIYDASGRLLKKISAPGTSEVRENNARYDAFGNLVGELGGEGSTQLLPGMTEAQLDAVYAQFGVRHSYDAMGRRTESIDAEGNKTFHAYDAAGRMAWQVRGVKDGNGIQNGAGEVTETRYNAFGEIIESLAYSGRITVGVPGSRASVLQALTTLQYVAQLDARQTQTYDARGLVLSQQSGLGYLKRYTYDAYGQLVTKQAFRDLAAQDVGEIFHYRYDALGRLVETAQAGDGHTRTWRQAWDAFNVYETEDANYELRWFDYDTRGSLVRTSQMVSGREVVQTTAYDAFGRVVTQTDATNQSTTYTYDDASRSLQIISPEGITVTTQHNAHGQTISVTNGLGQQTAYEYDRDGHLTTTRAADGAESHNTYDERGLLDRSIDATGRVVEMRYDAAGRVLGRTIDPEGLGLTTTYAYDGQGRQVRVTDPSGVVTQMTYDADGRLQEQVIDPQGLQLKTAYTWDGLSRQLTVTQGAGTTSAQTVAYQYDGWGRLTHQIVDPDGLSLWTITDYDANDNAVTRFDPEGRATHYAYDEANQLIQVVDGDGGVTRMVYDIAGRLVATRRFANRQQADGSVVADDARDIQDYRVYDRDGRMRYTVDGAGAVVEMNYDAANRLTQTRRYANAIDLAAARTSLQEGTFVPAPVADATRDVVASQVYDAAGRVRFTVDAMGAVTETRFDAAGRVIEARAYATSLQIDETLRAQLRAGQVTEAVIAAGVDAGMVRAQAFVYDTAGRRTYALTRATVIGADGVAVVQRTQYDAAGRVVAETVFGQPLATYQPYAAEPALLAALSQGGVITGEQRTQHYVHDAAGRVRFSVDAGGSVVEQGYDAVGQVVASRRYGVALIAMPADVAAWAAAQSDVRQTTYGYDHAGRTEWVRDALGHQESFQYDGSGLKIAYTNRDNHTWTYAYDAAGRLQSETSPQVLVTGADASGAVTQTMRAVVTRMEYDGQGNVLRRIEDAGQTDRATEYQYDNRGHQVLTRFPDAGRVQTDGSIVASGTRPTIEITYDTLGRAVVEKDVMGYYRQRTYDAAGQLSYEVDQLGGVTGYSYNAYGEQVQLTRFGQSMQAPGATPLSVDAIRANVDVAGAPRRTMSTRYDLRGQKVEVQQSAVAFDAGSLGSGTASPTTRFAYDTYGQLVRESVLIAGDANNAAARWAETLRYYDAAGRNTVTVDAGGYVTRFGFNAIGEMVEQTEFARALSGNVTVGQLPGMPAQGGEVTGFDRTTHFTYDALGRKTTETAVRHVLTAPGTTETRYVETRIGYDNEGHATSTTVDGQTTLTGYDALGRAQSVTESARNAVVTDASDRLAANAGLRLADGSLYRQVSPYSTMSYDAFGNVVQLRRFAGGAGSAASASDQVHTTRYDAQGRAVWERDEAGTVYSRTYDAADRIVESRFRLDGSGGRWSEVVNRATYDATGRQTSSKVVREQHRGSAAAPVLAVSVDSASYVRYNSYGEIEAKLSGQFSTEAAAEAAEIAAAFARADGAMRYEYDSAGRLARSNEGGAWRSYEYDLAGRQTTTTAEVWLGSNLEGARYGTMVTRQELDALGRVLAQTMPGANMDGTSIAVQQRYDRWGNVIEVLSPTGGLTQVRYNDLNQAVVEIRPQVKVLHANGTEAAERPTLYSYYDALGRLVGTRDANGNERRQTLDAAGRVVASADGTGAINRVAYDTLGQQVLSENALGYVTFQTYDQAGRVTAQGDFLSNGAGGRVRYVRESYVLNQAGNRVRMTDALGNSAQYDFDSRGLVLRSRTAAGVVMDYGYDADGRKIRETNGLSDPSLLADTVSALRYTGSLVDAQFVAAGRPWSLTLPDPIFDNLSDLPVDLDVVVELESNSGYPVTYSPAPGLSYDAASRTLSGSIEAGRRYRVTVNGRLAQTGESATAQIWLNGMEASAYDAYEAGKPAAVLGVRDIEVAMGAGISRPLPAGTFVDPQGQPLRYALRVYESRRVWHSDGIEQRQAIDDGASAMRQPGDGWWEFEWDYYDLADSKLAGKLTFNADTGEIGGQLASAGQHQLQVVAIDPDNQEQGQDFVLTVKSAVAAGGRTAINDGEESVYRDEQTWDYDIFGRLTDHNDLGGADYDYVYDSRTGQQVGQSSDWTTETISTPVYDYYAEEDFWREYGGRPTGLLAPTYETSTISHDRELLYYANGQLREIREGSGASLRRTVYEYDAAGNRSAEETWTRDGNGGTVHLRTTMKYDSHSRLVRVTQTDMAANKGLLDLRYDYDAMGNRRRVMAKGGYGTSQPSVVTTAYPPVVAQSLANQYLVIGTPWSWQLPDVTFSDPEGGPLGYEAVMADGSPLPDWLSFDPATRTFSGSPPDFDGYELKVTATDLDGLSVSTTFEINVVANRPPEVVKSYERIDLMVGHAWTLNVSDAFVDPDGQPLIFVGAERSEGMPLPEWLHFDVATGAFTALPPEPHFGFAVWVTVRDAQGAEATLRLDFYVPERSFADSNYDFEQGDTGWIKQGNWAIEGGGGAYSGLWKAVDHGYGDSRITNQARLPVVPGQQVTGRAIYHQGAGDAWDNWGAVWLVWFDAAGNEIGHTQGNIIPSSDGGFQWSTVTAGAPSGAAFVSVAGFSHKSDWDAIRFDSFSIALGQPPVIDSGNQLLNGWALTGDSLLGSNDLFPGSQVIVGHPRGSTRTVLELQPGAAGGSVSISFDWTTSGDGQANAQINGYWLDEQGVELVGVTGLHRLDYWWSDWEGPPRRTISGTADVPAGARYFRLDIGAEAPWGDGQSAIGAVEIDGPFVNQNASNDVVPVVLQVQAGEPISLSLERMLGDLYSRDLMTWAITAEPGTLDVSWLQFDPLSLQLSGTPGEGALIDGVYQLRLDAASSLGAVVISFEVKSEALVSAGGFNNLDFSASPSTSQWAQYSSGPAIAEHVGYVATGAYPGTATLTQEGRRAIAAGQSVTVGVQFEFHGYTNATYGHGVPGQSATGFIVWFDAAGNEIGATQGVVLNGAAGYAGWQSWSVTGTAPSGAAGYSMRLQTSYSHSGSSIFMDNAGFIDPNGQGGTTPASSNTGGGGTPPGGGTGTGGGTGDPTDPVEQQRVAYAPTISLMRMIDPEFPEDPGDGDWPPGGGEPVGDNPLDPVTGLETYWYSYDGENRVNVVHGKLDNGQIVVADNSVSHALAYDAAGNAVTRTFYQGHALNYERTLHDERGQRIAVYDVPADGADVATAGSWQSEGFAYDDVGRLLKHRSFDAQGLKHIDAYAYDADGRQLSQSSHGRTVNNAGLPMLEGEGLRQISNVRFHGYDAAGRSLGYTYSVQANEIGVGDANSPVNFSQTFTTAYEARDSYLEKQVLGTSTNTNFKASQSTSAYDAWGRRIGVTETTPGQSGVAARSRYFAYDMEGNILQRLEDGKTQTYAYAAGQNVASGKNTATGDLDVLNQLTAYQSSDLGDGRVQVQAGDTLRGIAQRVYGNSNLWYVLAEANAIASDVELVAGTTLKVPDVKVTANDATTFKPFNPNEAVGNTAPSLPYITPPPKNNCNIVKMIVIIVVAIVVTYFTAGAMTGAFTSAAAGTASGTTAFATAATATTAASLTTTGAITVGAVAGAAGSLASQAVGSAMGATSFSWRNVAAGAITGAISGGIASQYGTVGQALTGATPQYLKAAGLAFANVAAGYAGQAAVGNQTNFNWKAVTASVIGSLVSAKITPYAATKLESQFAGEISGGLAGGLVSSSVRKALDGTEPNYVQIATDAFGNALGNAIVGGIQSKRNNPGNFEITEKQRERAAAWAFGMDVADDGTLIRRPLDAERSATRLDELKNIHSELIASGRDYRTTRTENGVSASGGRGWFVYDPNLWDMGPEGYPVPKSVSVIDAMQNDPALANAGYDALYANSLRYAINAAERGSAVPFEFPGLNASPQALLAYNNDVQWWLYERSKSTPLIGAAQGMLIDGVGGTFGVLDSLKNGVVGAATLAYDFAGSGMLETGVSDLLGLRSYHQQSADRLGATVAGVVDFVSNDGRGAKIYNHFADRFAQADRYAAQGGVVSRLTAARMRSSAVFDIGTGVLTAGEGAAFTWAKATSLGRAGMSAVRQSSVVTAEMAAIERRAYLNARFERTGNLDLDIAIRGRQEVANSNLRLYVPVSTKLPDGTVLNAIASPARILSGDPNKVAIVGRSMDAVEGYAAALRANGIEPYLFSSSLESGMTVPTIARKEFSILSDAYGGKIPDSVLPSTKMFYANESWALRLRQENYTVIDLGNPFNNPNKSLFFEMEQNIIFGRNP